MCVDEKATIILGVPSVMQGIRQELHTSPLKYKALKGSLNRICCGGRFVPKKKKKKSYAPPKEMIQWFHDTWGIELIQGWGMTEVNPLGTVGRRYARRDDLTSDGENENQDKAGLLLPSLSAKILNSDDMTTEVPWDGIARGELLIRIDNKNSCLKIKKKIKKKIVAIGGPWVTKEYFDMDATEKFVDDWLITGDVASFTSRAQLVIRDRSKDMIKSGGEWISSKDMENLVMSMSAVDKACVIGVPHPKWDERPIVVAQLKPKHKLEYNEVIEWLSKSYAKFQLPDDLLIWDEIPLGSTGKMDKKTVRKILTEQKYVLPSLRNNHESKL
ncbi:acyl-CoA synthetase [Reticulomyxa filosa]|uniref:Acyl-CoA synthetase n=1 Tax=Reticulomyxa filosa TaxID=46433 RepID=X6MMA9_RETFI|nr:acyl-CoA synthetase [Reticulomyxa filosa]|eukprot:ETO14781.1 acyl-CoA synthetase [Reticulomyxa filosa]